MATEKQKSIERLQVLTQYTVEEFETKIKYFRNILEEKVPTKDSDIAGCAGKGVSSLVGEIPLVGSFISTITGFTTKKAVEYFQKKCLKKDASALCKIAYETRNLETFDNYKKIIIEVCFYVFYSLEKQCMNVTAETGGETRAMMKLSHYIVHTILKYLIANDDDDEDDEIFTSRNLINALFTDTNIIKIWYDKIIFKLKESPIPEASREIIIKLNDKSEKCETFKLFTKVGVEIKENDRYNLYSTGGHEPKKYGYRRLLEFDDQDTIKSYKIKESTDTSYNYTLNMDDKDELLYDLFKFIEDRDPNKMEIRIKKNFIKTSDDIVNVLKNLCEDVSDIKGYVKNIGFILEVNGNKVLKMIVKQQTETKRLFDEAQRDRDLKHEQLYNKLDEMSSNPSQGNNNVTLKKGRELVPVGNRELVVVNNNPIPKNINVQHQIKKEVHKTTQKEIQKFLDDF